jgi:hypothetical protein
MTRMQLVRTLAAWRPDLSDYQNLTSTYRIALKSLELLARSKNGGITASLHCSNLLPGSSACNQSLRDTALREQPLKLSLVLLSSLAAYQR